MDEIIKTPAQKHAELVDRVLSLPLIAKKIAEGAVLRVCPTCERLYEDFCTPDSVPYCTTCYGRLNRFAIASRMYVDSVPIEHAPDSALEFILSQLEERNHESAQT
jgi:hypothetical protein